MTSFLLWDRLYYIISYLPNVGLFMK